MARKTVYGHFVSSESRNRLLAQERLILEATECIARVMQKENVSKADLADRLGRSKAFVTQLLGGGRNMTMRTFADVMSVLGYRAKIVEESIGVARRASKVS